MISIPPWIALTIGFLVIVFGIFRIWLGLRPAQERAQQRGLYGLPRRTQLLVGIIYLILGTFLVLPALGVRIPLPWLKK